MNSDERKLEIKNVQNLKSESLDSSSPSKVVQDNQDDMFNIIINSDHQRSIVQEEQRQPSPSNLGAFYQEEPYQEQKELSDLVQNHES